LDSSIKAYIAGFLDGDGSIMLQIKPRLGVRYGFRIYATVCLYQNSAHIDALRQIQKQWQKGYLSKRNDGIAELRIDGYEGVESMLRELQEYVRFKRRQITLMFEAIQILKGKPTVEQFLEACRIADQISELNYRSNRKYTARVVEEYLIEKGLLSP
jgi:hypothetical protein